MTDLTMPAQSAEEFVRMLLWDDFPECCGQPVVGAEYMGQQEQVCCGRPEPALLSDVQIVATLRARFPEAKDGVSIPPKPFPAPGKWFPVDVTGTRPMREHAPGKWELAAWPSDGVAIPLEEKAE